MRGIPQAPARLGDPVAAIDTPLPEAPERVHMLLDSKANWVGVPQGVNEVHFAEFPEESLEAWHRRHGMLDET